MVLVRLRASMRELAVLLSTSLEVTIYLSRTHPITTTIIMKEEMLKQIMLVIELQHLKPSNPSMALPKMLLINKLHNRLMRERRAVQPIIMLPKLS
jgi:hypothetical protein